jgi:hypothetical protein
MNRHRGIKLFVRKGQICRVALLKNHSMANAYPIRHNRCSLTECLSKVKTCHVATMCLNEGSRCSAQTTADIEDARVPAEIHPFRQLQRRLSATDMKFIYGCQIGRLKLIKGFACDP